VKVLFDHQVFSYQQTGGVSRYFAELFRGLLEFGCQVHAGFRQTVNQYLLNDQGKGIVPTQFSDFLGGRQFKGKNKLLYFLNSMKSRRVLAKSDYDVFHPSYYDPYFLASLGNKPFVLTIHDMIHELFPDTVSDAASVQLRKRLLAEKAAAVIAVSEHTRQDIIRILGLPAEKVHVIYHGNSLAPEYVKADPSVVQGLALKGPYMLYVGGRSGYKNVSVVWESLFKLQAEFPGLHLVHVGGGGFSGEERATLDGLNIQHLVHHTGASDAQLAGLYLDAQALVYPSRYEGFGLPLLEAMAWGCPVIAAQASCLSEIGGDAAQYVDPENVSDWILAIRDLLNMTTPQRSAVQEKGLQRAQQFNWKDCVHKTIDVYRKALA